MGLLDLERERDETERETDLDSERETDRERDLIRYKDDGFRGLGGSANMGMHRVARVATLS